MNFGAQVSRSIDARLTIAPSRQRWRDDARRLDACIICIAVRDMPPGGIAKHWRARARRLDGAAW